MKLTVALFICGGLAIFTSGTKCPSQSYQPLENSIQKTCWDESDSSFGCCRAGIASNCSPSPTGKLCYCNGGCRGWSVDISSGIRHIFPDGHTWTDYDKLYSVHGSARQCKMSRGFPNAISARANGKSCVKLWEKPGCSGKALTLLPDLNGDGRIDDVRRKGLVSGIAAVSDCAFTQPKSNMMRLFKGQYFGGETQSQDVTIIHNECKPLEIEWQDKVRMIKPLKEGCFKIWERENCTGAFYCDCDMSDLLLYRVAMSRSSSWDLNVRALSTCDYPVSYIV